MVIKLLRRCYVGLTGDAEDIHRRQELYGSNEIKQKPIKNFFLFIWEAWWDKTLVTLTVAAIVSLLLSFYHPKSSLDLDPEETHGRIESCGTLPKFYGHQSGNVAKSSVGLPTYFVGVTSMSIYCYDFDLNAKYVCRL